MATVTIGGRSNADDHSGSHLDQKNKSFATNNIGAGFKLLVRGKPNDFNPSACFGKLGGSSERRSHAGHATELPPKHNATADNADAKNLARSPPNT